MYKWILNGEGSQNRRLGPRHPRGGRGYPWPLGGTEQKFANWNEDLIPHDVNSGLEDRAAHSSCRGVQIAREDYPRRSAERPARTYQLRARSAISDQLRDQLGKPARYIFGSEQESSYRDLIREGNEQRLQTGTAQNKDTNRSA
ncbi:Histone deacetylase [Dorcoceras hygrometricum]|uniref:Histone deacetylase n=1 Tax=Dorcoceras hygrometricum TaxID=472368 RepID=A0A2Z7BSG3_9LAMI|nr:Histone deacetylase [Dorcoceras hygrometricum]